MEHVVICVLLQRALCHSYTYGHDFHNFIMNSNQITYDFRVSPFPLANEKFCLHLKSTAGVLCWTYVDNKLTALFPGKYVVPQRLLRVPFEGGKVGFLYWYFSPHVLSNWEFAY
jgi:hypothetical protein